MGNKLIFSLKTAQLKMECEYDLFFLMTYTQGMTLQFPYKQYGQDIFIHPLQPIMTFDVHEE